MSAAQKHCSHASDTSDTSLSDSKPDSIPPVTTNREIGIQNPFFGPLLAIVFQKQLQDPKKSWTMAKKGWILFLCSMLSMVGTLSSGLCLSSHCATFDIWFRTMHLCRHDVLPSHSLH